MAAADLIGHLNVIHANRIHVLGAAEVGYLQALDPARLAHHARELIAGQPIALIVAEGFTPPPELMNVAVEASLPIFVTPLPTARVIDRLRIYLTRVLAPHSTLHGVFMDVLGMGVLISGESGVGKSELGLELISRGHGLVADDVVDFACSKCADSACSTSRQSSARQRSGER